MCNRACQLFRNTPISIHSPICDIDFAFKFIKTNVVEIYRKLFQQNGLFAFEYSSLIWKKSIKIKANKNKKRKKNIKKQQQKTKTDYKAKLKTKNKTK